MADELKPCPFCRAPGEIEHGSDHHGAWFNLGCSRHWGHVRNPDHSNTCIAGRIFYTETEVSEAEAIAAWNTRAAMSDDADMYDTPSARITGDKDRENPVEGAQPAPSDYLVERVARAIYGAKMPGHNPDCLYQHHDHEDWPVDDRREYADPFTGEPRVQLFHKAWRRYEAAAVAAIAAVGQDTRSQVEREIVAWLRAKNGTCDCYARSEEDCACGAWDDYKRVALVEIIHAIEQGRHRGAPG